MLTGALLEVAALLKRVAAQLAMEVVLPELGKPDVAPVVVQRAAGEVAVEAWQGTRTSGPQETPFHLSPALPASPRLRDGPGREGGREEHILSGPRWKKQNVEHSILLKMKRAVLSPKGSVCNLTTAAFMGKQYTVRIFLPPFNYQNANIRPLSEEATWRS